MSESWFTSAGCSSLKLQIADDLEYKSWTSVLGTSQILRKIAPSRIPNTQTITSTLLATRTTLPTFQTSKRHCSAFLHTLRHLCSRKSLIEREFEVVHSQFEMQSGESDIIFEQVLKSTANPERPLSNFGMGTYSKSG